MAELTVIAPIGGSGIKTSKGSDKGIVFENKDGNDYNVYPCLPGKVIKVNDEKITISHKEYVKKDYRSFYEIDGDIKVKEGQSVSQTTVLGITDEDVEFKVKEYDSYIDAKSFIGKVFGGSEISRLTPKQKARCIALNIVGLPHKAFGQKIEDECSELYSKKKEKPETQDTKISDDGNEKQDNDYNSNQLPQKDSPKLGDGGDKEDEDGILDKGMKLLGSVTENKKLNEEVSRIKNLIKIL